MGTLMTGSTRLKLLQLVVFAVAPSTQHTAPSQLPPTVAADATVSTPSAIAGRTSAEWPTGTINVKDFGAKGDGRTDDTVALKAAIAAAGAGTVFFPVGTYLHTGLSVTTSVQLVGEGWNWDGTVLKNTSLTQPGLSITGASLTGVRVFNMNIVGSGGTSDSRAFGIYVHSEGATILDRVYVTWSGGPALYLDGHTSGLTIQNCRFQSNRGDGIYGRTESSKQLNAISIIGSDISQNKGHGINLWANAVNVRYSVIQGNGGAGIFLNADDMRSEDASATSWEIVGNYFEENRGGAIRGLTALTSRRTRHHLTDLHISGNYLKQTASRSEPGLTGAIVLAGPVGSYSGLWIGPNTFNVDGTLAWIDFSHAHDARTSLVPTVHDRDAFGKAYKNTDGRISVVSDAPKIAGGPPTSSADFMGQRYLDSVESTWYIAASCGTGASDWKPITGRRGRVALSFGAEVAIDSGMGTEFVITATDGRAFAISTPKRPARDQRITIRIRNGTAGPLGPVTWSDAYRLAAWANPLPGHSRAIDFLYDGMNWLEVSRTPLDVPN